MRSQAETIKDIRARLGLTQVALAQALGVSFPTVNRWENAKAKPSPVCWAKLIELDEAARRVDRIADTEPPPFTSAPPMLDFTADPENVRSLVEGERLSFGHLANPAFATETSSIDPLPHQRIAVYDSMLTQPRLRFLLADDAGAGKTIMTGLYIREMLSRRLLSRILIVPPAGLVGNWKRELETLFSLRFEIVSGADARDANPFVGPAGDRVIVSVDTLTGGRVFSRLRESGVAPYDLVVFDEAHKLSANRGSDYRVTKTERYKLAEALAGASNDPSWQLPWRSHHLLLLTATPHMGKDYPYYSLWRLLEPDILASFDAFEQFPAAQRKRYFIRRTKEEMVNLGGQPLYPRRIADTFGYQLTQGDVSEQRLYDETTQYLLHVYNRAKVLNQSAASLAMGVFQRRLASSTYALLRSFERRIEKLDGIIDDIRTGKITIEELIRRQNELRDTDDVLASKTADEESEKDGCEENEISEEKILARVVAASLADLLAEREEVRRLLDLARRVHDSGHESKYDKLQEIVTSPKFANEKLIVFTEHRDTLDFLVRRLNGMGYTGQIATIHGGMHFTERQEQVEKFRRPVDEGGARFMVCTDAAAEGINLQFCWIMINYDVPWNPARLEQRMGRIHRYGQKHDPVVIMNLVAPSTREGRVLKVLLDKLEKIRKQLRSEKVYDSIGRIFSELPVRRYMEMALLDDASAAAEALDGQLTKEQVKSILDQDRVVYGDGGDIRKELPRLREAIERETFFRLLPGYIRRFLGSAAPRVGVDVEGDLGAIFSLRSARPSAIDPLLTEMDSYPPQERGRLSVSRPDDRDAAIWIHPGEPVFERFREIVRGRLGEDALRGAVFVDPTAARPYIFHVARLTVLRKADPDVTELAKEEVVECRLVGLRQTESSDFTIVPVEQLLLLRGGTGLPAGAQRLALIARDQKTVALSFLTERVARSMAVERRNQLLASIEERTAFINRGYDFREADLARERAKISTKAREGDKGAVKRLEDVKEQQRALSVRRENALAIVRREPELIMPGEVDFIAHALVVPSASTEDAERLDADIEQIAMELTRSFEEAAGAKVRFVHTPELARAAGLPDHPGFDVLSHRPDGERRCIEVKGRAATGEIEVTENEWARACNLRSEYWMYAVYDCASSLPKMVRVQDPFAKLLVRPFLRMQLIESVREMSGVRIGHAQVMEVGEV